MHKQYGTARRTRVGTYLGVDRPTGDPGATTISPRVDRAREYRTLPSQDYGNSLHPYRTWHSKGVGVG
eukprot:1778704-Rhodomonas_salina.2